MIFEKIFKIEKGIQGAAFGIVDGIIAMLGTTFAISVFSENPLLVLVTGIAVGFSNGIANAAGFFISEEVESQHGISGHTPKEIYKAALFCFVGSVGVVILALFPYLFFSFGLARILSLLIGALILFLLGVYHATISKESRIGEGLKFFFISVIAALLCYGLGYLIKILTNQ